MFSKFDTLKGKTNNGPIDIDHLHYLIKESPNAENIEYARANPHSLDELKRILPIITPHGIFKDEQKSDSSLISLNEYVFIDVDKYDGDLSSFKQSLINRPEIVSCWISVSGKGIHALAHLKGLSPQNFKEAHKNYLNLLEQDLGCKCDRKVCTISSGLVLSSDINILINDRVQPIDILSSGLVNQLDNSDTQKSLITSILEKEEVLPVMSEFYDSSKWQFKKVLDSYPQDCIYYPEGIPFFSCFLPFDDKGHYQKIKDGFRNTILSTFCNNLIILNPDKLESQFISFISSLNNSVCVNPLSKLDIVKMVGSLFNRRDRLKPINVTLKKYWINPNVPDKLKIFAKFKKESTLSKIEEFFSELPNYENKVTEKFIADKIGMSKITIERNLTQDMKSILKEHNEKYLKYKRRNKK